MLTGCSIAALGRLRTAGLGAFHCKTQSCPRRVSRTLDCTTGRLVLPCPLTPLAGKAVTPRHTPSPFNSWPCVFFPAGLTGPQGPQGESPSPSQLPDTLASASGHVSLASAHNSSNTDSGSVIVSSEKHHKKKAHTEQSRRLSGVSDVRSCSCWVLSPSGAGMSRRRPKPQGLCWPGILLAS